MTTQVLETRNTSLAYDPDVHALGGYPSLDGTVEFYGRINAVLKPNFKVLDYGAGRGKWFFEDSCAYRRHLLDIRSKVDEFIGADIDAAVLSNPTTSRNVLIQDGKVPLADKSIDLIICDFVLEHLSDVESFKSEIARVLKPGGLFCARTPHKYNYVCLGARMIKSAAHSRWLRLIQPGRKAEDVFPTVYKCNTHRQLSKIFKSWPNYTYTYTSEPQYFFGRKWIYALFSSLHKLAPSSFTGTLFIFLQKPMQTS